jgi:hypothetical protein
MSGIPMGTVLDSLVAHNLITSPTASLKSEQASQVPCAKLHSGLAGTLDPWASPGGSEAAQGLGIAMGLCPTV